MTIDKPWFRQQFDSANISQNQVAQELGIPRSAMTKLLTGKRALKASEAVQLAEIIDAPLPEVLTRFGILPPAEIDPVLVSHIVDNMGQLNALPRGAAVAPPVLEIPHHCHCIQFRTASATAEELRTVDGWYVYTGPFTTSVQQAVGRWVIAISRAGELGVGMLYRSYKNYHQYNIVGPMPLSESDIAECAAVLHIVT
ncbi:helix-turn-helix domain-containing protein [Chromobacterium phragmitis]|uniref:HTH cro/C1-type domain-containing protein n=1 Tax=Chromobacterium phragmitis TaxID=2202141 RepID=A0A344UPE8_9NEIS|nr:helix-turn-helix transcriptional regulator [Chromobacterium phragmitis]AXE37146.1 hypothetical protein DK843_22610 [Chromobacterium phragmitis]